MDKSLIDTINKMPTLVSPQDISSALAAKPVTVAINRATFAYRAYYECQGFRPQTLVTAYDRPVQNRQQAYLRYYTVDQEWMRLDFGWLQSGIVGEIHMRNTVGTEVARISAEQMAKAREEQLVFIGVREQRRDFVIRPKGIFIAEKHEAEELWLSAETPINIEVAMFPR